jgi:hypothetical protein
MLYIGVDDDTRHMPRHSQVAARLTMTYFSDFVLFIDEFT